MTTVRFGSESATDMAVYGSTSAGDAQRRAVRLCVATEPHTGSMPCAGHLHQARSQLSLRGQAEEPEPA